MALEYGTPVKITSGFWINYVGMIIGKRLFLPIYQVMMLNHNDGSKFKYLFHSQGFKEPCYSEIFSWQLEEVRDYKPDYKGMIGNQECPEPTSVPKTEAEKNDPCISGKGHQLPKEALEFSPIYYDITTEADGVWCRSKEATDCIRFMRSGYIPLWGMCLCKHKNSITGKYMGGHVMVSPDRKWVYPQFAWQYIEKHHIKPHGWQHVDNEYVERDSGDFIKDAVEWCKQNPDRMPTEQDGYGDLENLYK